MTQYISNFLCTCTKLVLHDRTDACCRWFRKRNRIKQQLLGKAVDLASIFRPVHYCSSRRRRISAVLPAWTRADRRNMRSIGLPSDLYQRIGQSSSQWRICTTWQTSIVVLQTELCLGGHEFVLRTEVLLSVLGLRQFPLLSDTSWRGISNCSWPLPSASLSSQWDG